MLAQISIDSMMSTSVPRSTSSPGRELDAYCVPAAGFEAAGARTRFDLVLQALSRAEQHDGWQPVRRRNADELTEENS